MNRANTCTFYPELSEQLPQGSAILSKLTAFFSPRQIPAYLVGGYLRDSLLSLPCHDADLAIQADPFSVARELAGELRGTFIPLGPAHGVARIIVRQPDRPAWNIDLTGLTGSIEEDLAQRDFTVDAMALPLEAWDSSDWQDRLIDPCSGQQDIRKKLIRAVRPQVFQEDPGRLLRAVRLAAHLKFRIVPETARLIRLNAGEIEQVSGERLRDEFLTILAGEGAQAQLEILDRLDLLCRFIPELAMTKGVDQPKEHYWDVWNHLLHTVDFAERVTGGHQHSAIFSYVPWTAELEAHFNQEVSDGHTRRTILKLAALFHDIAKPQTKKPDDTGRIRFLGHPELGAVMTEARLTQLRLSSRGVDMVSKMVEQHLRPAHMSQGVEWPTQRAIYRYFRDLGDVAIDNLYLCLADYLAAKGPNLTPDDWIDHARMVTHILQVGTQQTAQEKQKRLITGHDLMEHFNLSPGRHIGAMLDAINEAVAAGEITTPEEALALAAQLLPNQYRQE